MCFGWSWLDKNDHSVFGVYLANQDRHVDLEWPCVWTGIATRVSTPWYDKNDQCAFGMALVNREQRIVFDWPWRENNAQSMFGVALAGPNACPRKCG